MSAAVSQERPRSFPNEPIAGIAAWMGMTHAPHLHLLAKALPKLSPRKAGAV
jgi:hypothetical protein